MHSHCTSSWSNLCPAKWQPDPPLKVVDDDGVGVPAVGVTAVGVPAVGVTAVGVAVGVTTGGVAVGVAAVGTGAGAATAAAAELPPAADACIGVHTESST